MSFSGFKGLLYKIFIEKPSDNGASEQKTKNSGNPRDNSKNQQNNNQEQLQKDIEEILKETKVEDGWEELPFYPRLIRSYHDNLLYMTGYDKPLTDGPITGFEIKEELGRFSIRVYYQ